MGIFFLRSITIGIIHSLIGFLLYRSRILNQTAVLRSDMIVFYLPFLLAMIGYGGVFWLTKFYQAKPLVRIVILIVFSLSAAGASTWLFMFIGLNRYGS